MCINFFKMWGLTSHKVDAPFKCFLRLLSSPALILTARLDAMKDDAWWLSLYGAMKEGQNLGFKAN